MSKETFTLILEHCPNPDIGGYWQQPVTPKKITMEVSNLAEARSSFESWRDANGLGFSNLTNRSGKITRKNGQTVGRFSYNGRFWNPQGKEVVISTKRKHEITSDLACNPQLRAEIGELRGGIMDAAESVKVSTRFTFRPDLHQPRVNITDTKTGKTASVAFCDYRGVREILATLFPIAL